MHDHRRESMRFRVRTQWRKVMAAVVAFGGIAVAAAAADLAVEAQDEARRPPVIQHPIPFGSERKLQMRGYAHRHYGIDSYRLENPKVIVEHFTAGRSFQSAFDTFASNAPDVELHERPGVCAHFLIARDGAIHQLVSLSLMCRHTIGLNWTSVGIEHVGVSDNDIMGNKRQLASSLQLTRWLQQRLGVRMRNVIGHAESLSSPYHHERVRALANRTHGDFRAATMRRYRRRLAGVRATASSPTRFELGRSVRGRSITATRIGDPAAARKVLVVGSIHGDETAGRAIARRLEAGAAPPDTELWVIGDLNPDGTAAHTRQNARRVDLNRNFPHGWRRGGRRGARVYPGARSLSEPETRAARRVVRMLRPHVTIWFHQPLGLVDRSGGDERLQRRFARVSGLPLRSIAPLPGTATRWQNHAYPGTTAFVVELPPGRLGAGRLARYTRAVRKVVAP